MLLRDDLFAGDAAQHTWWMYHFADPALFPNDRIARYMSLPAFSPPGYQAIFRIFAPLVDPQHLAESLAILAAMFSLGLLALIGRKIAGRWGMAAAMLIFALFDFSDLHTGGFARSFGLPLLAGGMLAVISRRWAWAGIVILIAALLYPPIVLVIVPVACVAFVREVLRSDPSPREGRAGGSVSDAAIVDSPEPLPLPPRSRGGEKDWRISSSHGAFLVALLFTAIIIAALYLRPLPAEIGPWFSYSQALHMPEWNRLGRNPMFRPWNVYFFQSPMAGIGLTVFKTGVAAALLLITIIVFPRAIAPAAWVLLATALGLWMMAHVMLFKLYLPSRYTMYAFPVFAVFWAAGIFRGVGLRRARLSSPKSHATKPVVISVCLFLATAILGVREAMAMAMAMDRTYHSVPTWDMSAGFDQMVSAIRELPNDALIAADPFDANAVPLRARRSVLVNDEVSVAFNTAYYTEMSRRIDASFDMLYATDWTALDDLADREHVTVFLLDRRRLTSPDDRPAYEPFRTRNVDRIARGRAAGFVMLDVPPARVIARAGDWVLLRVGRGAR